MNKKKKVNIPYSGLHFSGECKDTRTWPRTGYTATVVHTATILPLSVAVTQSVASEASQQVLDRLRFYYQHPIPSYSRHSPWSRQMETHLAQRHLRGL